MSQQYFIDLDLNGNAINEVGVLALTTKTEPLVPADGTVYYDGTDLHLFDGDDWDAIATISDLDLLSNGVSGELDATQAGAGLGENGEYVPTGDNYVIPSGTTSLAGADGVLDAALKAEEEARVASDTDIQDQLNSIVAGGSGWNDTTAATAAGLGLVSNGNVLDVSVIPDSGLVTDADGLWVNTGAGINRTIGGITVNLGEGLVFGGANNDFITVDTSTLTGDGGPLVPTVRAVIAGSGLTGGGTLDADVTVSVDFGQAIVESPDGVTIGLGDGLIFGTGTDPDADVISVDTSTLVGPGGPLVPTTRQIIVGDGLTGGGPLSADVHIGVDQGPGIVYYDGVEFGGGSGLAVNADLVTIDIGTDDKVKVKAGGLTDVHVGAAAGIQQSKIAGLTTDLLALGAADTALGARIDNIDIAGDGYISAVDVGDNQWELSLTSLALADTYVGPGTDPASIDADLVTQGATAGPGDLYVNNETGQAFINTGLDAPDNWVALQQGTAGIVTVAGVAGQTTVSNPNGPTATIGLDSGLYSEIKTATAINTSQDAVLASLSTADAGLQADIAAEEAARIAADAALQTEIDAEEVARLAADTTLQGNIDAEAAARAAADTVLQTAITTNDGLALHKSGPETVTGIKTFAAGATPVISNAPVGPTDAVNKAYVDSTVSSGGWNPASAIIAAGDGLAASGSTLNVGVGPGLVLGADTVQVDVGEGLSVGTGGLRVNIGNGLTWGGQNSDFATVLAADASIVVSSSGISVNPAALVGAGGPIVPTTRSIIAGDGLSGGGTLDADVTLTLNPVAGGGIGVDASGVWVDTGDALERNANGVSVKVDGSTIQIVGDALSVGTLPAGSIPAGLITDNEVASNAGILQGKIEGNVGVTGGGVDLNNDLIALQTQINNISAGGVDTAPDGGLQSTTGLSIDLATVDSGLQIVTDAEAILAGGVAGDGGLAVLAGNGLTFGTGNELIVDNNIVAFQTDLDGMVITAGAGLTGGGDINAAGVTVDIVAAAAGGIAVTADAVAVDRVTVDTWYDAAGTGATEAADAVTAHEAAADPHVGYQLESQKGVASGYAPLGADNLVPSIHLPSLNVSDITVVADAVERKAQTGLGVGDVTVQTSDDTAWIVVDAADLTLDASWSQITNTGTVTTVNGKPGPVVTLVAGDIGSTDGDVQTDINAINAAVALKADKATTVTAGDGLTGGGTLGAALTLAVGAGNGIAVAGDTVSALAKTDGGLVVGTDGIALDLSGGGIGQPSTPTRVVRRELSIVDGVPLSPVVSHGLGVAYPFTQVYDANGCQVMTSICGANDLNTVTINFQGDTENNTTDGIYTVVVMG